MTAKPRRSGLVAMGAAALVAAGLAPDTAEADGLFDLFGGGSGGGGLFGAPQPQAPSPRFVPQQRPRAWRAAHARISFGLKHRGGDEDRDDASGGAGRRSICVRLCDGYAFPIGAFRGERDRAAQEMTCRVDCPGAATALYTTNEDPDAIGDAVRVGTNVTYASLPAAFRYKTAAYDPRCACHAPGAPRIASILHDYTLRRGDAVMTGAGLRIFHGGAYPYKPKDFSTLWASRDVPKEHRAIFAAMERVLQKQVDADQRQAAHQPSAPPDLTVTPREPGPLPSH